MRLKVSIPTDLTSKQRELFKSLAETFDSKVTPQENKGFFDKVKGPPGLSMRPPLPYHGAPPPCAGRGGASWSRDA